MKRRHRKKLDDRYVPIDGVRVRAAIERSSMSVKKTAEQIGVPQQTLDSIVNRKVGTCRASVRERLGNFVKCSSAWLGGEKHELVRLPRMLHAIKIPPSASENGVPTYIDPDPPDDVVESHVPSARYQLAWRYLGERICTAWRRDIDRGVLGAQEALDSLTKGIPPGLEWDIVMVAVERLLSAFHWRAHFFKPTLGAFPSTESDWVKCEEGFAVDLTDTIDVLLEPWFAGRGELDHLTLSSVLRTMIADSIKVISLMAKKQRKTTGTTGAMK